MKMNLPCNAIMYGWPDVGAQKYNPQVDQTSDNFVEGNLKHSINGYLFCNMPDVGASPDPLAQLYAPADVWEPNRQRLCCC